MGGRGSLRVYLGAAPGVGKTFAMLNEGRRRAERGTDVVIGLVETHGRAQTAAQLQGLDVVPRAVIEYRGATLGEMDIDAVLARRPAVALVDELAHTNIPGSRHDKRWEDVEELLDAGIDVITTLNIQHLESLNDVVNRITGTTQRETVPDVVVRRADQIELIDMSPEAVRRRMAHGNIYAAERIDAALANYFRPGNLGALRELALLWVADRVDDALHGYRERNGISDPWETRERVLVGLTGVAGGETLVRRAARMAGRLSGELVAVHVVLDDGLERSAGPALEAQRRLVRELGGEVFEVVGHDPVPTIVDFARSVNATQIVLGASRRSRWQELVHGSFVARLARQATSFDVHVITTPAAAGGAPRRVRRHPSRDRVRFALAAAIALVVLPLLTVVLTGARARLELSTVLLVYLTAVLVIAAIGGRLIAVVVAVAASLIVNWYFVDPVHTFTITEGENVVALLVFVVVAVTVGWLVDTASRRAVEARRSRLQAEALARSAANLVAQPDPLPAMLDQLRATFEVDGVRLHSADAVDPVDLVAGDVDGPRSLHLELASPELGATGELDVHGRALSADEQRVLRVIADQLSVAVHTRRLGRQAADATRLADIDAVRTAMLRAVSHDLRSPLASIKAMVTGLRDPDVHWSTAQLDEALATVEEETDRLDRLVGNLLDASRLQIGALATDLQRTQLGEVVEAALRSAAVPADAVAVEIADDLPTVLADGVLLERCVANLVTNALRFNPPAGPPVQVDATALGDEVHLRVVDHGPGIAADHRQRVLEPFQRLDDVNNGDGLGLGLSIANGLVTSMHGRLHFDDTAGGGLTATVILERSTEVPTCPPS